MRNLQASLEAHGFELGQVVKCTVMLADMNDWPQFNEVYTRFFQPPYPARSAFGSSGLALGSRLEIEAIAVARS